MKWYINHHLSHQLIRKSSQVKCKKNIYIFNKFNKSTQDLIKLLCENYTKITNKYRVKKSISKTVNATSMKIHVLIIL